MYPRAASRPQEWFYAEFMAQSLHAFRHSSTRHALRESPVPLWNTRSTLTTRGDPLAPYGTFLLLCLSPAISLTGQGRSLNVFAGAAGRPAGSCAQSQEKSIRQPPHKLCIQQFRPQEFAESPQSSFSRGNSFINRSTTNLLWIGCPSKGKNNICCFH